MSVAVRLAIWVPGAPPEPVYAVQVRLDPAAVARSQPGSPAVTVIAAVRSTVSVPATRFTSCRLELVTVHP